MSDLARIEALSIPEPNSGCWLWEGPLYETGYARLGSEYAHRVAYVAFNGPIPEGKEVDHRCNNPACVSPLHIRALTHRDNSLRSLTAPPAINARRTHCVNGHALVPENLRALSRGGRSCKICHRERQRRYDAGRAR